MDLGGTWRARVADDELRRTFPDPDVDDRSWEQVEVPGHWRAAAAFAASDGPLLYRRRFTMDRPATQNGPAVSHRRSWLNFNGIFYQGDVWLDGFYLGDTEGYFVPHSFEITDHLADRSEHLLAVEAACSPQLDRRAKRNLTGVYQHWNCIDEDWNPGGIFAAVSVSHTGPVRIDSLRVTCPEASAERATLELVATLDAVDGSIAQIDTRVFPELGGGAAVAEASSEQRLAQGANRVRWRVLVEGPELWWPRALGTQPLHRVEITITVDGEPSDARQVTTGFRQISMRNFVANVNGERMFLKGANLGPTRRAPGEATPGELAADVGWATEAGLDLLRVHAHVARHEFYDAADRAGMLLWQDLPLQWAYKGVRKQAVRQARAAVNLLAQHPSVALWCGHNEPFALQASAADPTNRGDRWRRLVGQSLPSWNRTRLDRSLKRTLSKSDGSRPVVAHAGVLPHPVGGTDSHLYLGWYRGSDRDMAPTLARLPVLARWVGEFGAQAVPHTDGFMAPEEWPDLDWERLEHAHGMEKAIFDQRVPPGEFPDFSSWREATQRYQADVIRYHIETLRRLKYRPAGGFCQFLLADAQPAVSWSVLDHRRVAKVGYGALRDACAPVIVVADRPRASYRAGDPVRLALHVVSDLRVPMAGVVVRAEMTWPGGNRTWSFEGDVPADSCVRIGRLEVTIPADGAEGEVELRVTLRCPHPGPEEVHSAYFSRVARTG
jgi:beta-mannosidase